MKTSSDPREWYRQEEIARYRSQHGSRRKSPRSNLAPMYIAAACIAIGVIYLVLLAAGVEFRR
jgi:hypothetical protein